MTHRLYGDEDFSHRVLALLAGFGHDVHNVNADGHGVTPDPQVLLRAIALNRTVLTFNTWDYVRLHGLDANHHGIITCSRDEDADALSLRIHLEISNETSLLGRLIRIRKV